MDLSLRDKHKLILLIAIVLGIGFVTTSLASYFVSRSAIRSTIVENELPITADTVYSEIQKDLIRPIFVSSMMASDTFVRDWVLAGERDVTRMTRYLKEVQSRYQAVTSFFVSEKSRIYYQSEGVLKRVSESAWRDVWYFRVRQMGAPYEINVDPDLAHRDTMTIFINYRVFDYRHRFIGATGVGLAVDSVKKLVNDYQRRYGRNIFFADRAGKIVLQAAENQQLETDIRRQEGLSRLVDRIFKEGGGSFIYERNGETQLLNVRFIPELNWYLFVEKAESAATAGIRRILYLNLGISLLITLIVLCAATVIINRYQTRLEKLASLDKLTGLYNRHAFDIVIGQLLSRSRRTQEPFSVVLFDIDHFKEVNDRCGHSAGDQMLKEVARVAKARLRSADILCRWGGEEFLAVLPGCRVADAVRIAEGLRQAVVDVALPCREQVIRVTASLGVAEYLPGEEIDPLLQRADRALYRAKEEGRNRVAADEGVPR
ncbi:MAG: sensor domain-containing diguanylate cyclase [Deltaproteobacteria bacterium]|nr:sensor domain-containing diguanylate cyclase [Deltaproteobacteria bacterium]